MLAGSGYCCGVSGLSSEQSAGLGVALNEATFLDLLVEPDGSLATITLEVLSWNPRMQEPTYPRVSLLLGPIGRVVASLRHGAWNDRDAIVESVELASLRAVVTEFGPSHLYGWEFIDCTDHEWAYWEERPSLDRTFTDFDQHHYIHLFKDSESPARFFEVRIWFDQLRISDVHGRAIELEEFIQRGRRWWDAMYAGDSRTAAKGIFPGAPGDPGAEHGAPDGIGNE